MRARERRNIFVPAYGRIFEAIRRQRSFRARRGEGRTPPAGSYGGTPHFCRRLVSSAPPEFKQEGLGCVELLSRLAPHGGYNYSIQCRHGLLLQRWVEAQYISRVLDECCEPSVEVFWNSPKCTRR